MNLWGRADIWGRDRGIWRRDRADIWVRDMG